MESNTKKLPREEVIRLYNSGYDFYDISVAESLSMLCNKTPQELLPIKGKTQYIVNEGSIQEEEKDWKEIVDQLGIKLQKPTEVLEISQEQTDIIKKQGYTDEEVQMIVITAFNYKVGYNYIIAELKKGKTLDEVNKECWNKRRQDSKKIIVSKDTARKNTKNVLKKQYKITEEDIKLSKDKGITDMVEMAMAKDIASKKKVKLEDVLKEKIKENKSWKEIPDGQGGLSE